MASRKNTKIPRSDLWEVCHRFKEEKWTDKDSSDATKDIIELFALPSMIETLDEVGIMEFTGTFLILYDKKGKFYMIKKEI